MDLARILRNGLGAGIVSAVVATTISAVYLALYFVIVGSRSFGFRVADIYAVVSTSAILCIATAPSAVPFGLLAGFVLGAWLSATSPKVRSKSRVTAECFVLGTLLSMTFPLLHGQLNRVVMAMWGTRRISEEAFRYLVAWPTFLNGRRVFLFAVAVGVPCAILVGVIFGRTERKSTV